MRWEGTGAALFAAALAASVSVFAASASAQSIGEAERIEIYAYGTKPGEQRRPLFPRQGLVSNEVVETVERGGAALRLVDDTTFMVGPASTVTLDRFVYDPNTTSGQAVLRLGVGTFRYVSGRMAKEGIALRVPSATIGVRGTTIGFKVEENQGSMVQVTQGSAILTPDSGAPPIPVAAGQTAIIAPDGGVTVVTTAGAVPPITIPSQESGSDADGSPGASSESSSSSGSSSSGSGGGGGGGSSSI
jgi:hypothetical protein